MTIIKGESLSIAIVINNYDKTRIVEKRLYIGSVWYQLVEEDNMLVCRLTSQQTDSRGIGRHHISLWLDDTILGVRKPELGDIIVMPTGALKNTESESSIYNLVYTLDIIDDEITVDDVLYNYVKGDAFTFADFTPEQITELQAPALEAKEIVLETNENVTIAEGLRADTESARVIAESLRVTDESSRVTVEGGRVTAEQDRVNAENIRVNAESTRVGNESIRVNQESARVAAEAARVAAGAEIQTNKTGDVSGNSTSTTKYPTVKGLFDWVYSLFARKSCELSPVANTYLLFDYVNSHWQVTIPDGVKIVLKDADRLTASGISVCVLSDNQINHLYYNTAGNTIIASTTPTTKQPSTCYYFGSINTYTGAETINVNSPFYKINGVLTGSNLGLKIDSSNGFVGLTALKINFKNVANTFTSYFTNTNTASRTYTFPDKTGTIGMNEDILMRTKNRAYIMPSANTVAGSLSINSITSPITGYQLSVPADLRVALDGYESRIITVAASLNIAVDGIYAFFIRKSNSALVSLKLDGTAANMTAVLVDADLYLIGYFNPFTMPTSIVMFTPIYTYNGEYYGQGALKVNPATITAINNTLTTINTSISTLNTNLSKHDYLLSPRQILNPSLPKLQTTDLTKILFIGSSFLMYTAKKVRDVTRASSLTVRVGNIYHAAISFQALVTAFNNNDKTDFTYRTWNEDGSAEVAVSGGSMPNLMTILTSETWDIIVIQQDANNSTLWSTFQPHMTNFISLLKRNATNPNVVIAINQTWTMNHDVYNMGFVNESDAWTTIFDNYKMASHQSGIDLIIPCGSAQRSMRTTSLNGASGTAISKLHNLTCDDQHPDLGIGLYLNACTVFESIFKHIYGVSVLGNTYRDATSNSTLGSLTTPITDDNAPIAQKCAIAACANRFGYTDFTGIL